MNILLVTVDCLRQDRCGTYGYHRDTTPTLDALARYGFVFENAYATGPVTTESFPGILAGRLSAQTVAGDNLYQKCLPEGAPTIASHLRDEGYSTVATISNPRIGTHTETHRGFDSFTNLRTGDDSDSDSDSGSSPFLPSFQVGASLYQLRERMRDFDSVPYRYEVPFLAFRYYQSFSGWPSVRGDRVVTKFLESLERSSSPYFGWIHLMDVHGPLQPKIVSEGGLSHGGALSQFRSHAKRVSDVYDPQIGARYDSSVRYVDGQLGRIVQWLKTNEQWDETALIVTADHGEALYDHGIYGHAQHYTYDEVLKVPLVVRVPKHEGYRIKRPFSLGWLHDVVTEIAETRKMEAPLSTPSESPILRKRPEPDTDDLLRADSISHRGHSIILRRGNEKCIIQTGELVDADENRIQTPGSYQIDRDPKERFISSSIDESLNRIAKQIATRPDELGQLESEGIDESTKDRLRQLGYAE